MQYPLFPFKETNDRLSQYIVDVKDDQKFKFIHELKVTSSEILLKQTHENKLMTQSGSNTENIDLQPLFLIKLVILHQKHLKG